MQLVKRTEVNMQIIKRLSELTGLDSVVVRLLYIRGLDTEEKINRFLYAGEEELEKSPTLKNTPEAKEKILSAIKEGKSIVIYADYDCDGIGAAAILYLTLKHLHAKTDIYIPVRHGEGYGLNKDALTKIYEKSGKCLIVTVDCGITAVAEIAYAKSLGMDIIVTDHHERGKELPDALIINPHLNENFTPLCGAGVAFKLAQALAGFDYVKQFLDICALSTIADVVPLLNENRIIVKLGLELFSKRQCRIGLEKLIQVSEIKGFNISSADIAFRLAPRLNAAGRLSSALTAFKLLVTEDEKEAVVLANALDAENKERQEKCIEVINDAMDKLKSYDLSRNYVIALYSEDWEEGVIGIAASKLTETFNRPAILFVKKGNALKGSGRSIHGISLYSMLEYSAKHLIQYGGHAMAAGLTLNPENLEALRESFNAYVREKGLSALERKTTYDSLLDFRSITKELATQLSKLEPFGIGNPKPVFVTRQTKLLLAPIAKNSPHIKQTLQGKISIIGFNMLSFRELLASDSDYVLVYNIDTSQNRFSVAQCVIKDILIENFRENSFELLHRYLNYYTWKNQPTGSIEPVKKQSEGLFGTLYIALTVDEFVEVIDKNPQIERYVYNTSNLNPYNAAVLLPDKKFPFWHYNRIVFLEKPSDRLVEYISSRFYGEIVVSEETKLNIKLNINTEMLREAYLIMLRAIAGTSNIGLHSLFELCEVSGFSYDYAHFIAAFNIFSELDLLCIGEDDIICFNGNKVRLEDSEIFKMLNR